MSRIVYAPPDIAREFGLDPTGEWVLEEEIPERWEALLEELDTKKSEKIKDLINKTINNELEWNFTWVWFTGGFFFPVFISNYNEDQYRIQVAQPPKDFGYIIVVTSTNGYFYDSVLDDEDYPEVGMELWHLIEDVCKNHDYFIEEITKRLEANKIGETYPPITIE
jgi:hypothetical protein